MSLDIRTCSTSIQAHSRTRLNCAGAPVPLAARLQDLPHRLCDAGQRRRETAASHVDREGVAHRQTPARGAAPAVREEVGVADVTFERISKWKLLPRFMMLVMTLMSWRCAEWFMNLDSPTAAQSAFVSVVMGAMTGAFGIWMGGENKVEIRKEHDDERP